MAGRFINKNKNHIKISVMDVAIVNSPTCFFSFAVKIVASMANGLFIDMFFLLYFQKAPSTIDGKIIKLPSY